MDSSLQGQGSRPEPARHRESSREVQRSCQYQRRLWHQPHLVCSNGTSLSPKCSARFNQTQRPRWLADSAQETPAPSDRCSSAIGSAFIGTNSSVGRTRQSKTSCLGLSSRFLFERVWVTQGLPCILLGVALDKTPSISGKKFRMGRLTSSPIHPYQV